MRVLFLGDIVGRPGREAVAGEMRRLREELALDVALANAENASGGLGLKPDEARRLLDSGLDVLTSGNHIWKYRE
ncbi:MAG: YmdB family metallophosphoesterase, partial [Desulfocurvibacter africanus]